MTTTIQFYCALPPFVHSLLGLDNKELKKLPPETCAKTIQAALEENKDVLANRVKKLYLNRKTGIGPDIPKELSYFSGIKVLTLSSNGITKVGNILGGFSKLEVLDLSDNHLTGLPKYLYKLPALRRLEIARNPFRYLRITPLYIHGTDGKNHRPRLINTYLKKVETALQKDNIYTEELFLLSIEIGDHFGKDDPIAPAIEDYNKRLEPEESRPLGEPLPPTHLDLGLFEPVKIALPNVFLACLQTHLPPAPKKTLEFFSNLKRGSAKATAEPTSKRTCSPQALDSPD